MTFRVHCQLLVFKIDPSAAIPRTKVANLNSIFLQLKVFYRIGKDKNIIVYF